MGLVLWDKIYVQLSGTMTACRNGSLHRTLCFLSAVWMCFWRCHCDYDLSRNTASWICLNGDIPAMETNTWHEWKSFHRFIIKPNTENSANSFSEASPLHTNSQTEMSQRVYSLIWKKSLSVTFTSTDWQVCCKHIKGKHTVVFFWSSNTDGKCDIFSDTWAWFIL